MWIGEPATWAQLKLARRKGYPLRSCLGWVGRDLDIYTGLCLTRLLEGHHRDFNGSLKAPNKKRAGWFFDLKKINRTKSPKKQIGPS